MAVRNMLKLGSLDAPITAFLLFDIQETFRPHIKYFGKVVKVANKMAHVCIEQTVIDLLNADISVHVLADGVSSRSLMDRGLALQRMQSLGCIVTSSESVLFKLLQDKNHPLFKHVSKLCQEPKSDVMFKNPTLPSKL